MKRIQSSFKIIPFILVMLSSCDNNNSENNKRIIGNWSGVEWLVDGKPSTLNVQSTHFSFDDKGKYSFEYAATKEEGTYKVENEMLFTKPSGREEIMVKITKLTKDTLVFDMNRGGQPEMLTLLRK